MALGLSLYSLGFLTETYDVVANATSQFNIVGTDATTDELTIDTQPPVVTLNSLTTNLPRPDITGTIG